MQVTIVLRFRQKLATLPVSYDLVGLFRTPPRCSWTPALQLWRRADGKLSSMSDFLLLGQHKTHLVHFIFCDCTLARGVPELDRRLFFWFFGWFSPPPEGRPAALAEESDRAVSSRPRENQLLLIRVLRSSSLSASALANSASVSAMNKAETFRSNNDPLASASGLYHCKQEYYKQIAFFSWFFFLWFFSPHKYHLHLEFALFRLNGKILTVASR